MEYIAGVKTFHLKIFMVVGPAVNKMLILFEYWFKFKFEFEFHLGNFTSIFFCPLLESNLENFEKISNLGCYITAELFIHVI
jgi:hypothetical protein